MPSILPTSFRTAFISISFILSLFLTACGGGGGGSSSAPTTPTYSLGGTISGISSNNSGLVLANGNTTATIAANGSSFSFGALTPGSSYDVVVQSAPPGMTCVVVRASGTLNANVSDVVVTCGYTLGGGVTYSLNFPRSGSVAGLVITNNANGDSYTFTSNGSFKMPMPVPAGGAYALVATTQPSGLSCIVSNGSGTMPASDFNVNVTCQPWFSGPAGITVDANGNIYVADTDNNVVKQIVAGTRTVITLASGFNIPTGVAVDLNGNVYVADSENNAVKQIAAGTFTVTTLASGFNHPTGVAVDVGGNVYVTDTFNNAVKRIAAGTGAITTISSAFSYPGGIAVDVNGNVYVADSFNHQVKKIAVGTGAITTLGSGFYYPHEVAVDTVGNVYVTDQTNRVQQIAASNGSVTTLASASQFNYLEGIAVDLSGNVYVTDSQDNLVKEILKETGALITLP